MEERTKDDNETADVTHDGTDGHKTTTRRDTLTENGEDETDDDDGAGGQTHFRYNTAFSYFLYDCMFYPFFLYIELFKTLLYISILFDIYLYIII